MKINAPLAGAVPGIPGNLRFDPALGIGKQFAQPSGEGRLQAPKLSHIGFAIFAAAAPAEGHRILLVVKLKAGKRMATSVAQKIGPAIFVGAQHANDKHTALIALAVLYLLFEPLQLVFAPGRGEVTRRHHDQQNAGRLYLAAQFVGDVNCRIDLLIPPDMQIVEFGIDRPDIGFESANQLERPVPKRRVRFAALNSVRIADENVIFEMRQKKRHAVNLEVLQYVNSSDLHFSTCFDGVEPRVLSLRVMSGLAAESGRPLRQSGYPPTAAFGQFGPPHRQTPVLRPQLTHCERAFLPR